jgi:hypothetical protein
MMPEYEWRDCVGCKACYLEDCKHQEVGVGGIKKLPDYCYREDLIKLTPKPHMPDDI